MKTICMICRVVLAECPGEGISHGYCRLHELEALVKANIATPEEEKELKDLTGKTDLPKSL